MTTNISNTVFCTGNENLQNVPSLTTEQNK